MKTGQCGSLMVFLCVTANVMAACDGPGDPGDDARAAGLMAFDGGGVDRVVRPRATPQVELAAAAEFVAAPAAVAEGHGPKVRMVEDWVRWAMALPAFDGPISDMTGELCALGQEGPVWFLAGTRGGTVTRECEIPAGKQLFFPLINVTCVFFPEYFPTEESIEAALPDLDAWYEDWYDSVCSLTLRIDGEEVFPDFDALYEELFVMASEPFDVELHDEHFASQYGLAGGSMFATGIGHYAWIPPLTPGDHIIELGGSRCGDAPFSTGVTYLLHVDG